jgi:hypothetical protein
MQEGGGEKSKGVNVRRKDLHFNYRDMWNNSMG